MNQKPLRIVIASGGTGGHITPAQALLEQFDSKVERRWIGRADSMESRAAEQIGVKLWAVNVQGVRGKSPLSVLRGVVLFVLSVLRCLGLMIRWRPDVVVGFGGYVSAAAGMAAWLLRVPLVLHEQNAVAGSTNRMLSKLASAVAQSFPETIPGAVLTGNPVRSSFAVADDYTFEAPLNILVMGGSQGALALNEAVPVALSGLQNIATAHQCGEGRQFATETAYQQAAVDADVFEFDSNMAARFEWADLLIARAGATTVAEVARMRMPTVFVPLPNAIDDHQRANARFVAELGGAVVVEQGEDFSQRLRQALVEILANPDLLLSRREALKNYPVQNAEQRMKALVMEVINGK
ncbi:MAG: undecaprenyldiphospho-muramoylpentapeptide beta-N-acetylglucosaminyltransferase [Gammaproteobacteria bacterium]|nr:undecaprenyldiphospho-muramoylpentapeptide beta-N-acetylglucosaminyltransferase [Gammaproteobacteria bacterium]